MKKLLLILLILMISFPCSYADEQEEIQFIYINGSNNNDNKMKKWFFNGVNKLHPHMFDSFKQSSFVNSKLLHNGKYKLSEKIETFFWGDRSSEEIESINTRLKFSKMFSPKLAQTVRTLLAYYLHDAIWVSHYRNMHPVIEDLHKQVMDNYKKKKSVILFGYSAGSFITYEYMFNKLPNLNIKEYFNKMQLEDSFMKFVEDNPKKDTCIDALIESKLAVFSADGHLIPNINNKSRDVYLNLDDYTCQYCVPKGALKGIVNFGSPLILFYSDISNPAYSMTYYNKLMYKYILENDMFWLTVNYSDDPLGYPTTGNVSFDDIESKIQMDIVPNKGFIYTKENVKSRYTFIGAHTSYWKTGKKFSKAVIQAYEDGYKLYNDNEL